MYKLPNLPYDYDALGEYISKDIMLLHHSKHHQTYVDKLNTALKEAGIAQDTRIEDLLADMENLPEGIRTTVRNNGGGHYNHSLFWQWMSPEGGSEPGGELSELINKQYGSYQKFVDEFTAKALGVFGSGWVWLQPDMSIITTANQDTPIGMGMDEPLLGLDVWEHAYYLDYKNKRDDYVKSWWNVVNWDFVQTRLPSREK